MKTLLFDYTSAEPYYTLGHASGIGRSTFELVKAIRKLSNIPFKIVFYSQNAKGIGKLPQLKPFKNLHFYFPKREPFFKISKIFGLKYLFSNYDLIHIPHHTDKIDNLKNSILTIHDLIVYHYPEMWGLKENNIIRDTKILNGCKAIVTCSHASKNDIIKFFNIKPDKITVIPWGVNRDIFFPENNDIYKHEDIGYNFFLCTSCNHSRKQAPLILESFRKYKESGGSHQLVMLGVKSSDTTGYQDLIKNKSLIILKGISDDQLRWLYSNAKASIVVSLYEGFGLPVLESLACHTQVICAKNSSLIEAGGDVVDYLVEPDLNSLSKKLLAYNNLKKEDSFNIEEIEKHLQNFTWEKTAKEYVKFYDKILNS